MTEVQQLTLQERMREATKRCYNKKIKENKEFYEKEKKRVQAYIKNRYALDEEYRERVKAQKRASYHKKKELMAEQN